MVADTYNPVAPGLTDLKTYVRQHKITKHRLSAAAPLVTAQYWKLPTRPPRDWLSTMVSTLPRRVVCTS